MNNRVRRRINRLLINALYLKTRVLPFKNYNLMVISMVHHYFLVI